MATTTPVTSPAVDEDPFLWLEDVLAERQLEKELRDIFEDD